MDHKTLEDDTVTMRDRDTMKQVRVKVSELPRVLREFIEGKGIEHLGVLVE